MSRQNNLPQVTGLILVIKTTGGMNGDIYQSMAEGVQGAACVICFMTQKYQDSENCQLELKFAKQVCAYGHPSL